MADSFQALESLYRVPRQNIPAPGHSVKAGRRSTAARDVERFNGFEWTE